MGSGRYLVGSVAVALATFALVDCGAFSAAEDPPNGADAQTGPVDGTVPDSDGGGPPPADGAASADALVGDATQADGGPMPCTVTNPRVVFISGQPFKPSTGRQTADKMCQDEATDAGLCGTFVAWLSMTGANAIDRVADKPYHLVTGAQVVPNRATLTSTGINAPIDKTAHGTAPAMTKIWTGTKTSGLVDDTTCNDWSTNSVGVEGTIGDGTGTGGGAGNWTDRGYVPCTTEARVACFQE